MLITDLLLTYAAWVFAAALFFWLGSVLYRTTRDTLNAFNAEAEGVGGSTPQAIPFPARPVREPTVHLAAAA